MKKEEEGEGKGEERERNSIEETLVSPVDL